MSKEQAQRAPPATGAAGELDAVELGQIVVRAATTIHDLTATIAAEMPLNSHIDAFGGSAWAMD